MYVHIIIRALELFKNVKVLIEICTYNKREREIGLDCEVDQIKISTSEIIMKP